MEFERLIELASQSTIQTPYLTNDKRPAASRWAFFLLHAFMRTRKIIVQARSSSLGRTQKQRARVRKAKDSENAIPLPFLRTWRSLRNEEQKRQGHAPANPYLQQSSHRLGAQLGRPKTGTRRIGQDSGAKPEQGAQAHSAP